MPSPSYEESSSNSSQFHQLSPLSASEDMFGSQQLQVQPLNSPYASSAVFSNSPYTSSSSSSSPEESNEPKDLDINDPEINLLMDLMEKVGGIKNLENSDVFLKEVLNPDILNELSIKLNAVSGDIVPTSPQITDASSCWYPVNQVPVTSNGSSFPSDIDMEIDTSLIEEETY